MNNNDMNVVGNGIIPDNSQYVDPNQTAMYQGVGMGQTDTSGTSTVFGVAPTDNYSADISMGQTQVIPDMGQTQVMPVVQSDMSVYQNTIPVSNTVAGYPTDINQTMGQTMNQAQVMAPIQPDMGVYQNTVPVMPVAQPSLQAIPAPVPVTMPMPGIPQPDMSNYSASFPQPMVNTNAMASMQQPQVMAQPNYNMYQQPMPNAYPALGSINPGVPTPNPAVAIQNSFQTTPGTYQSTGATQVGRVNTYQTVANNKKNKDNKKIYKKGFNFRSFLLVIVAIAAIAFLYYLYTTGYFDAYIKK